MEETDFYQQEWAVQGVNSEVLPLVKKTTPSCWCILAVRYRTTHKCISSKAALLILFWSFTVTLGYGLVANPDTYMQVLPVTIIDLDVFLVTFGSIFATISEADVALAAYGSIVVVLIFCPLAGFLADLKFSRYKVVLKSLHLSVLSAVVAVGGYGVMRFKIWETNITASIIIAGIAVIVFLVGFAGFTANVLQFGMDQLHDSPGEDRALFIHWYVWVYYVSVFITQLSWNIASTDFWYFIPPYYHYYTGIVLSVALFLTVSIASVCLGCYKQRWLQIEPTPRPAYENPIMDAEHFKAILKVLLSFGMVSFLDFGANSTLPLFALHNTPNAAILNYSKVFTAQDILINKGVLSPLLVVVCIPLYLFLLRPFISYYIPGMLKRMGIGMCLVLLSLMLTFSLDTATHYMHKNSVCMFKLPALILPPSSLLDTFNDALVVQNILSALSNMLIHIAVFEFICSQSPHSMKGLLVGLWYAIKGLYQMFAAVLVIPYIFWSKPLPSCGFGYYLMNIIVGVFTLLVYVCVARRYKYREMDFDPRIEP